MRCRRSCVAPAYCRLSRGHLALGLGARRPPGTAAGTAAIHFDAKAVDHGHRQGAKTDATWPPLPLPAQNCWRSKNRQNAQKVFCLHCCRLAQSTGLRVRRFSTPRQATGNTAVGKSATGSVRPDGSANCPGICYNQGTERSRIGRRKEANGVRIPERKHC